MDTAFLVLFIFNALIIIQNHNFNKAQIPYRIKTGRYLFFYLKMSMIQTKEVVHPAGGDEFTSVSLTPGELEKALGAVGWCDVCKGWED